VSPPHAPSREAFLATLRPDPGTRARARGWALWKAAIGLAGHAAGPPSDAAALRRTLEAVIADARS
jgi:hypothetical protein